MQIQYAVVARVPCPGAMQDAASAAAAISGAAAPPEAPRRRTPEEAMVHWKQVRRRPRELAGVPGTGGRARAAAVAVRAPASSDPGYMRPTSSSCAREMASTEREEVRAKAVPRAARATCSSPHRHTAQTSAPRRSPPHCPRLRARRQPKEPAQGAGEAGSSSLVGRRPSAQALRNLPDPLPPGCCLSPDTLRQPGIQIPGRTCLRGSPARRFGARHLFDGNAEKLYDKKGAGAGSEDRLSMLPEEVIHLVLSFLSSRQAVRTCVLATRWRTLWKSVPSLRVDTGDEPYECSQDLKCFVDSFVRCRGTTPLHECDITFRHHMDTEEFRHDCELWLRYAVSCKVRVLRFKIFSGECLQLSAGTLISQHLTRLILRGIEFEDLYLDVLSCQTLEVLEMLECGIDIQTAFPKSLQHLSIRHTRFSPDDARSIISAPGLVTLELGHCLGWTPLLNRLPALVTAFINIGVMCMDACAFDICDESCVSCSGLGDDDCVLLQGLSGAANLELTTQRSMIFNKDIRRCPVFSKLKTLLLGDWCVAANFSGLVYFLQHSPILERLTLDTSSEAFHIQVSEHYKPKEQFLVSKHLKEVTVGYVKGDGRIRRILKLLAYHGVPSELIHTEEQALVGYSWGFNHGLSDTSTDEEEEEAA